MHTTIKAYAKVNLVLDVKGKRLDGYHEVDMIMQKIDLCDELTIKKIPEGIRITSTSLHLPNDSRNIVYRAAELMIQKFELKAGVEIHIVKRIPIAAGLAGGSTDAAAAIRGINEVFEIGLSRDKMMALGKQLGADVPFCFMDGAARAEGIGEILTPVKGLKNTWLVLTKPNISVSTQMIYQQLRPEDYVVHPDVDGMIEALKKSNVYLVSEKLGNVLEKPTFRSFPVVAREKQRMKSFGAKGALMSGSGPTVYGLFAKDYQAKAAYKNFLRFNKQTYLVKSYNGE